MKKNHFSRLTLGLCVIAYLSTNNDRLFADPTGDPSADLWTAEGTSTSAGNYIDGAGAYNVTIYTTAFTLSPSSSLISALGGYNWNAGDTIVGVGGTFSGANSDLSYSGGADEHGVTHVGSTSTRIVVKYGTSTAAWTTPGAGGLVNGGVGSVLLGTFAYDFYPANSGVYVIPTNSPQMQVTPIATIPITGYTGRVMTDWSGGTMTGFESFLDLTLLDTLYPTNGVALGNDFVLDLQRASGNFQDSLGTLPTSVPEPTTLVLASLGGMGVLLLRRRNI
jgi:hypothetical protein